MDGYEVTIRSGGGSGAATEADGTMPFTLTIDLNGQHKRWDFESEEKLRQFVRAVAHTRSGMNFDGVMSDVSENGEGDFCLNLTREMAIYLGFKV